MNEKEMQALLEKVKASVGESKAFLDLKASLENMQNGFATLDSLKEALDGFAKEHDIKGLGESIEKVALDLKKLQEAGHKNEKSLRERLIEEKETLDRLAKFDKGARLVFNVKTGELSVKTTLVRSAISGDTQAFRLNEIGQVATRGLSVASVFRGGTIGANSHGTIRYVDQQTPTRSAAEVAEAGAFPESAISWIERNLPIEKIGDSIPVSHEMLADVDFVQSELDRLLNVNIALREDYQLIHGNGTTPNLIGIDTTATAFSDSTPKIQAATRYDLLNVLYTKISNGKEAKYMGTDALMNPSDILKMRSAKDANNNYVMPPFVSADGMSVAGLRIVPSAAVTEGTLFVGDFRHLTYYTAEAYEVEIGWVNDQFTKDLMTMKARKRAALLHRTVDATCVYKVADIDAAVSNLTA